MIIQFNNFIYQSITYFSRAVKERKEQNVDCWRKEDRILACEGCKVLSSPYCFASIHGQLADVRTKVPLHKLPVHLNSPPGMVTILLHVVLPSDTLLPLDGWPPSCELALPSLCTPSSAIARSSFNLLCACLFKFGPKKITKIVMKIFDWSGNLKARLPLTRD